MIIECPAFEYKNEFPYGIMIDSEDGLECNECGANINPVDDDGDSIND